jgi:hypothetical protein
MYSHAPSNTVTGIHNGVAKPVATVSCAAKILGGISQQCCSAATAQDLLVAHYPMHAW